MHFLKARAAALRVLLVLAVAGLAVGLAACGSDSNSGGSTSSASSASSTSAATSGSSTAGEDTAALDTLRKGNEEQPPTTGPPAKKGVSMYYVSCGQAAPGCSIPVSTAEEAAKSLGWDFKIADGKFNVANGYATAIRAAIAAHPDVIAIQAEDCRLIQSGPLKEAEAAGIKTIAVEETKCPAGGADYTAYYEWTTTMKTAEDFFYTQGQYAAKYIIAKTGGKAKTIVNTLKEPIGDSLQAGFMSEYSKCSGCSVAKQVTFVPADLVPNGAWISAFRSAVIQNPDANATFIPFGLMIQSLGGGKAVKESGHKLVVVGGNGEADATDPVRTGLSTACPSCHDSSWMGYGVVDIANRIVQGQPVVPSGEGVRAVDQTNLAQVSPNPGDPYKSPIDWKAAYQKIWGVTG
jgi:ribose transport system substrate-binding protein